MAASFIAEPLLNFSLRRAQNQLGQSPGSQVQANYFRHLEWVANETLQLHRLAQEQLGWGGKRWKNSTGYVPVPVDGESTGNLDVSDILHPVLHLPPSHHDRKISTDASVEWTCTGADLKEKDHRVDVIAISPTSP
jgi:hypothetical protein